jgi:hypothetical protein
VTLDILELWAVALCTWYAVTDFSKRNCFKLRCKITVKM